jgi:hypothetical protein
VPQDRRDVAPAMITIGGGGGQGQDGIQRMHEYEAQYTNIRAPHCYVDNCTPTWKLVHVNNWDPELPTRFI